MKKHTTSLLIIVLFSLKIACSQNYSDNWIFGNGASYNFDYGNSFSNNFNSDEACASISNKSGELMYYTDGAKLWNSKNELVKNWEEIPIADAMSQSCIFIPHPTDDHIYYLFYYSRESSGFNYLKCATIKHHEQDSVINYKLLHRSNEQQKLNAIYHCNQRDIWILSPEFQTNNLLAYLITPSGINENPVISNYSNDYELNGIGYLKAAPTGNKLAMTYKGLSYLLCIMDFNNETGEVSGSMSFDYGENDFTYGVEFSPDGKFLYVQAGGYEYRIYQYDLSTNNKEKIKKSEKKIFSGNCYAIQLGIDGKIYFARHDELYLGIIHHPELEYPDCNVEENGLYLNGKLCQKGLPNFIQSWFKKETIRHSGTCINTPITFQVPINHQYEQVDWNIIGNNINIHFEDSPMISFDLEESGEYSVEMISYRCDTTQILNESFHIKPKPELAIPEDTVIYNSDRFILTDDYQFDSLFFNDLKTDFPIIIDENGIYEFRSFMEGCIGEQYLDLKFKTGEYIAPTAFTPNNDGLNDFFTVDLFSDKAGSFMIYNKLGTCIFQGQTGNSWDGTYKGDTCPSGTYIWYTKTSSGKVFKGKITLIR